MCIEIITEFKQAKKHHKLLDYDFIYCIIHIVIVLSPNTKVNKKSKIYTN